MSALRLIAGPYRMMDRASCLGRVASEDAGRAFGHRCAGTLTLLKESVLAARAISDFFLPGLRHEFEITWHDLKIQYHPQESP
ncbi:MAG TPA: hypothetical protein VKV37_23830 [Ktedonobacteraceae bacterium]|nr:hypothetical protein [Ktedonobacteraceae bacterium]